MCNSRSFPSRSIAFCPLPFLRSKRCKASSTRADTTLKNHSNIPFTERKAFFFSVLLA